MRRVLDCVRGLALHDANRLPNRVTRAGGRIALASWTPEGFLGDLFRTVAKHVPPPAGLSSPLRWGTEQGLTEFFGSRARLTAAERKKFVFRYRSAAHFIEVLRDYYGPTHVAFNALDERGKNALEADMTRLLEAANRGGSESLKVEAEYLEVVLEKS